MPLSAKSGRRNWLHFICLNNRSIGSFSGRCRCFFHPTHTNYILFRHERDAWSAFAQKVGIRFSWGAQSNIRFLMLSLTRRSIFCSYACGPRTTLTHTQSRSCMLRPARTTMQMHRGRKPKPKHPNTHEIRTQMQARNIWRVFGCFGLFDLRQFDSQQSQM